MTVVSCANHPAVGYSVVAWKRPGGKGDLDLGEFLHRYEPEEFEAYWNHGDIRFAVEAGRLSVECHEDQEFNPHECQGWKMSHVDWLVDDVKLYRNTEAEARAACEHRDDLMRAWDNADKHSGPTA